MLIPTWGMYSLMVLNPQDSAIVSTLPLFVLFQRKIWRKKGMEIISISLKKSRIVIVFKYNKEGVISKQLEFENRRYKPKKEG